jgi:hypothetical protein
MFKGAKPLEGKDLKHMNEYCNRIIKPSGRFKRDGMGNGSKVGSKLDIKKLTEEFDVWINSFSNKEFADMCDNYRDSGNSEKETTSESQCDKCETYSPENKDTECLNCLELEEGAKSEVKKELPTLRSLEVKSRIGLNIKDNVELSNTEKYFINELYRAHHGVWPETVEAKELKPEWCKYTHECNDRVCLSGYFNYCSYKN